jgi:DNA polymerase-3 subunit delta'
MPWTTPADERVIRYLDECVRTGRLAHAYLLSGPPGVGVASLAEELSQALLCEGAGPPCGDCPHCLRVAARTHADYSILGPSGPSMTIVIDDVRELKNAANLEPYEGRLKVFVVDGAERMTPDASNALLKLLEEPPTRVTIVLTTGDEDAVPETIRSRCQTLRLRPLPYSDVVDALVADGTTKDQAHEIALVAAGRIESARAFAEEPTLMEERADAWENLVGLVGMYSTDRMKLAARLSDGFFRDRETLLSRLAIWETLWREVLLTEAGAHGSVGKWPGKSDDLVGIGVKLARDALESVRFTIDALGHNANARLAIESLLLGAPFIEPRPQG